MDGLRAIAVLAVIAFHARVPFVQAGGRGVDVFFVLSGYLITGILNGGSLSIVEFWRRRAIRLVPALLMMTAVTLAISPWWIPRYAGTSARDALLGLTYTMNLAEAVKPWDNPFMHTWSLAAEVQFYLLWPFVLPWLIRRNAATMLLVLWALLTAAQYALASSAPWEAYYFPHFSGLVLGAALVFLPAAGRWLGMAGAAVVAAALINPAVSPAGAEIGAALLISSFRQPSALRSLLEWPPLVRLGLISYGVYLWHFPVHCVFEAQPWFIRGPLALAGGIGLGALSYYYVERRLTLRLRPAAA